MFHHRTITLLLAACLLNFATLPAATAQDLLCDDQGRPSLERWQAYHDPAVDSLHRVWQLGDGVLTCQGQPRGYLYTRAHHTDFVLRLQWRWPAGVQPGSGGVLVRMTGELKIWPRSLEAQLNAGNEGDFVGLDGYRLNGPEQRLRALEHPQFGKLTILSKEHPAAKPGGQWNSLEVEARGPVVTIRINGQLVNRATDCDVVAGPILLTAENDRIQFRRLQLEPLDGQQR